MRLIRRMPNITLPVQQARIAVPNSWATDHGKSYICDSKDSTYSKKLLFTIKIRLMYMYMLHHLIHTR